MHDAVSAFPAGRDFILNNWEQGEARGMNGVGAMLNHPALARAFLTFNNHIAKDNTLAKRICELLILRVSWLRQSEYEFQQHVVLGLRAGLTEAEIAAIQDGPGAAIWNEVDANLLRAADDLVRDACISTTTWRALSNEFSTEQMIDIVFTVGCYEVLAMAFKSFGVPFEACLDPMAPEVRASMFRNSTSPE
ncbi:MAG: carboxymuconolactone decarboxylase family protein [Pseudomonadota bacterium]|nr:carboxymuconolactone decarboxylase family protein [Pseudomonadota bacterium]